MNIGFCSAQAELLGGIKKKCTHSRFIFSGLSEVVEKAPEENFSPPPTQKHCVENGPKRCFLMACLGAPVSRLLCQPLLALRALEIVLTAAPCGAQTPIQSGIRRTVNRPAPGDVSEPVPRRYEGTLDY